MLELSKSSLVTLSALKASFIIPSYQRAFRWGKKQVENLLDDFYEFASGSGKTFFLQPLVVISSFADNDAYELIDGQQRLTALYLLDSALCHLLSQEERGLHYQIIYEARPGLQNFLKSLCGDYNTVLDNADESMDFYCLFQARQTILEWLANKNMGDYLSIFHNKLLNNIKFLWHDSNDEYDSSPVQKYIRINTGKIPLADGELCRALFLMPGNHDLSAELPSALFKEESSALEHLRARLLYKRRLILAHDWDQIERSLWDERFWNFIGGGSYKDSVRMGLLLELHNNIKASFVGEHICFDKYAQEFKKINMNSDAAQVWENLVKTLERLRYWYRSNDYYHWIGYLTLMQGYEKLALLLMQAALLREDEFKALLKEEIRKSVSPENLPPLDELSFLNNYELCKNILILFNIEYSRRHQEYYPPFPFLAFSLENTTIEHVYARNVENLKEIEDRVQWIEEHRNFINELEYGQVRDMGSKSEREALTFEDFSRRKSEVLEKADNFIKWARNGEKLGEEIVAERFNSASEALSGFIEQNEDEEMHSLYNLALLDHKLNSYFKNSIFAIKQQKLRQCLLEGDIFIPGGTIALFMRHFARGRREEAWWTKEDRDDYRAVLRDTLGEFWPELKTGDSLAAELHNAKI